MHVPYSFGRSREMRENATPSEGVQGYGKNGFGRGFLRRRGGIFTLNNFLEKCRFMRNFLWIIAGIGVFLVWKNAERHVGKKNIELH